jgi:hypothetical protein
MDEREFLERHVQIRSELELRFALPPAERRCHLPDSDSKIERVSACECGDCPACGDVTQLE